jgi:hypothetical protein
MKFGKRICHEADIRNRSWGTSKLGTGAWGNEDEISNPDLKEGEANC